MQDIRQKKNMVGQEAAKARADVQSMGRTLVQMHEDVARLKNEKTFKDREIKKLNETLKEQKDILRDVKQ